MRTVFDSPASIAARNAQPPAKERASAVVALFDHPSTLRAMAAAEANGRASAAMLQRSLEWTDPNTQTPDVLRTGRLTKTP